MKSCKGRFHDTVKQEALAPFGTVAAMGGNRDYDLTRICGRGA